MELEERQKVRFVDLFCGIGSFHYSFSKLGFECVMACDINKSCRETYLKNYQVEPFGDIIDIDPDTIEKYDILCAGFPCQPWSNIGKKKGLDDARGALFEQIMKFVRINKPPIIVLENVKGLVNHDKGRSMGKIINRIQAENYSTRYKVLSCNDYGIPQMRKRLFIVAALNSYIDINKVFDFDKCPTPSLGDFLGKSFEKKCAYTIRCGGRHSSIDDKHNWDGYIVDGMVYRLSIQDCLRLQGFPISFQLQGTQTQQFTMLGNTIPTNLTYVIGKQLQKLICQE